MCINHCLLDFGVSENFLQYEDIPPVHHKVRGKRMTECVHRLAFGQLWRNRFKSITYEVIINMRKEQAAPLGFKCRLKFLANWDGAILSVFCINKGDTAMGSATVRFTLANGKKWERIIDEPERFAQKANFIGSYAGYWWALPGMDFSKADNIFITEGIFNAMALR